MRIPIHILIEMTGVLKIFIALFAGGCIGWEREHAGKEAGIRTFSFICAGACALAVIAGFYDQTNNARIIANIVLGIGFLAGGTIIRSTRSSDDATGHLGTHGLTTAASLWITASVGVMIGLELYFVATFLTIFIVLSLQLPKTSIWKYFSSRK